MNAIAEQRQEPEAVKSAWRPTRRTYLGVLVGLVCLCAFTNLNGTTHYVSTNGTPNPPFVTWATAATNIQDAITNISPIASGDIIIVSNGVYGPISIDHMNNRLAEIKSANGAGVTIIDGHTNNRCVYISYSGTTIDGFTLMNGYTTNLFGGAGAYLEGSVGARLLNCYIKNNISDSYGAGVSMRLSATIMFCTIVSNTSLYSNGGGVYALATTEQIHNCIIVSNMPDNIVTDRVGQCYYSCTIPLISGGNNITGDPKFVDTTNWLLKSNSPCIDVGSSLMFVTNDCFKTIRPLLGKIGGSADYDIGAQEFIHPTADTDANGLPDWWEIQNKLNPTIPEDNHYDNDNDDADNMFEYLSNTDPQSSSSVFRVTSIQYDSVQSKWKVVFTTSTNRIYRLEGSNNLTNYLSWTSLTNDITGAGTNVTVWGTNYYYKARCIWTNYTP